MPALNSSNLASADYDADTQVLTITFTSDSTYEYDGVPQEVFDGLMSAPSAGAYFARQIKSVYPFRRVS